MKVLIISYSFPPSTAISSKRWFKLYQHSLYSKTKFTVLCANWAGEKIKDKNINYVGKEMFFSKQKSIATKPNYFDFLKHPTIGIRSISRTIYSNWFISAKKWIDLNRHKKFDLIICSYGPMSSVLLGNYAKTTFNIPLLIDLRDLISIQGQKLRIPIIHQIDVLLDKYFTRKADEFLTVSPTCEKKARSFYGKKATTIYNGLTQGFSENVDLTLRTKKLNVLYFGTLGVNRSPKKILQIFQEYSDFYPGIEINVSFASKDNPTEYFDDKSIPNVNVFWLGYLNKRELEIELIKSNVLLLLEDQSSAGDENLTGKVYEYISSKKPIIVSCSPTSDIVRLVDSTNTGMNIRNKEMLHEFLTSTRISLHQKLKKYSSISQFEKLEKTLRNVKIQNQ